MDRIAWHLGASLCALFAVASGWTVAQDSPTTLAPGDRVVTTARAELKAGEETLLTLEPGAELTVGAVQGEWILVRLRRDSQEIRGWVRRRTVRSAMPSAPAATDAPYQRMRLQFEETPLGPAPDDMIALAMFSSSPDARRIAYSSIDNGRAAVFVDAQKQAAYDEVRVGHPVFGPNSQHVAYVARRGADWFVVADGAEGPPYDAIEEGHPVFSADGKHLAYAAARRGQAVVVVDGTECSPCDAILPGSLAFGPRGSRLAFAAQRDGRWFAVFVDVAARGVSGETKSPAYDRFVPEAFAASPVADRFAYAAKRQGGYLLVVDGVESGPYDRVHRLQFAPDGQQVVGEVEQRGMRALVLAGRETKRFSDTGDRAFSKVVFSPDGHRMAYWARRADRWALVHASGDGATIDVREGYDGYCEGTLVFSPNGRRIACAAVRGDKAVVIVDRREGPPCDGVLEGTPIFSADGRRVAYAARNGKTWHLVVDGQPRSGQYGLIKERSVRFTPDGRHVVCIASFGTTGASMAIAVDGELSEDYLFPLGGSVVFDSPRAFHTVAARGNLIPIDEGDYFRMEDGRFVLLGVQIQVE